MDLDLPEQNLTFSFETGAPSGASVDAATGWFAWTPGAGDAGTTNTITVRVVDSGSPGLSGTRGFRVIVLPAMIVTIGWSGDMVSLSATATLGRPYRTEFKGQLNDASWTPLGNAIVAVSGTVTFVDTTSASTQRFYRIVQVD